MNQIPNLHQIHAIEKKGTEIIAVENLTLLAVEGCSTVITVKAIWQQNAAVIYSHVDKT